MTFKACARGTLVSVPRPLPSEICSVTPGVLRSPPAFPPATLPPLPRAHVHTLWNVLLPGSRWDNGCADAGRHACVHRHNADRSPPALQSDGFWFTGPGCHTFDEPQIVKDREARCHISQMKEAELKRGPRNVSLFEPHRGKSLSEVVNLRRYRKTTTKIAVNSCI